jgi:uncharacterized protein DUF4382
MVNGAAKLALTGTWTFRAARTLPALTPSVQFQHCGCSNLRSIIGLHPCTRIGMKKRLQTALLALAGGLGLLAGCGTRTDVSLTGNTPAQYSHVWVTVQAVWFNTSATAGPDDGGWDKFPLSTPNTVDLVAQTGGNLESIASGLRIPARTYSQVRLIPVDPTAALTTSAQNAGALFNSEADYVDSDGTTHQLPLEFLNPDKGIGIQGSLKVPVGNVGAGLSGTSTTTTSPGAVPFGATPGTTSDPFGTMTGNTPTGDTSAFTATTTTANGSTTANNSFAAALDGTSDLVPFSFASKASKSNGILLSARAAAAYDLSQAGGISGQLSLTNITTSTSGLPNIRVSAETLSADGTRHMVVSSTAVLSDGSFLLYPLATNSSANIPLTYDVVIHGPDIATIIIKGVQVPRPSSSSTTTSQATTVTTPTTSFTVPTTTTTTTGTSGTGSSSTSGSTSATNPNVNAVSIGTLTPRAAAPSAPTSYPANITTAPGASLPAGALVNFYQTLARQGEVPYVIESAPLDPFNQVLFNAQALSVGTVDSGTWSTNQTVPLVSAAPKESAGTYLVAASAPGFSDGPLDANKYSVSRPGSGTAGSLAATVVASAPGKYDQGQLLLSHDGVLVAAGSLDTVLKQGAGGVVTMPGLPSGTPDALYYATVRAWNSSAAQPVTTVQRQWYPQVIDLRTSTSAAISLTVN